MDYVVEATKRAQVGRVGRLFWVCFVQSVVFVDDHRECVLGRSGDRRCSTGFGGAAVPAILVDMAGVDATAVANTEAVLRTEQSRAEPHEVQQIEAALEAWAVERHNATPRQVLTLKSCLREEFLISLVEPSENHYWPQNPDGNSWHYLFRRQCFRVLGVYHRIPEGHPDGLPGIVNEFIRSKWWPTANSQQTVDYGTPTRRRGAKRGKVLRICGDHGRQRGAANPYPTPEGGGRMRGSKDRPDAGGFDHLAGPANSP